MICPECFGAGRRRGINDSIMVHFKEGLSEEEKKVILRKGRPCDVCNGTGVVDDDYYEIQQLSRVFNEKRVSNDWGYREVAEASGVTAKVISDMCNGRKKPDFSYLTMTAIKSICKKNNGRS